MFNSRKKQTIYRRQKLYDVLFIAAFTALALAVAGQLPELDAMVESLNVLEVVILVLAVFRLTQLFSLDNVLQWLRDLFLRVKVERIDPAVEIERSMPTKGVRREVAILLDCPWCISMWASLASLYLWFAWPVTHIFFYVLALSGAGVIIFIALKKVEKGE